MIFDFRNLTSRKIFGKVFKLILKKAIRLYPNLDKFELSLVLVDDNKIRELNKDCRKIDQATDVLSFLLDKEIGEIFISIETADKQARRVGHSLENELGLLFTHGILHLLGFNHSKKIERSLMFKTQGEILNYKINKVSSF